MSREDLATRVHQELAYIQLRTTLQLELLKRDMRELLYLFLHGSDDGVRTAYLAEEVDRAIGTLVQQDAILLDSGLFDLPLVLQFETAHAGLREWRRAAWAIRGHATGELTRSETWRELAGWFSVETAQVH